MNGTLIAIAVVAAAFLLIGVILAWARRDARSAAVSEQATANVKGVVDAVAKANDAADAAARLPDGDAAGKLRNDWSRD